MTRRRAPKFERNKLGQRLCRWCRTVIPKGNRRRRYCGDDCVAKFAAAYFPAYTRALIEERDHGVCAVCGRDTLKIRRVLQALQRLTSRAYALEVARLLGFDSYVHRGDVWQADHTVPVARGGWGSGPDKIQTTCTRCHKALTARLAAELAAERRAASQSTEGVSPCSS